jgi:hypothetical protein
LDLPKSSNITKIVGWEPLITELVSFKDESKLLSNKKERGTTNHLVA